MNPKASTVEAPIPISSREEKKQVEVRAAIGTHVVYEAIRREGEDELQSTGASIH